MSGVNPLHLTFTQALCHAKALSGMAEVEISERSGIGPQRITRYFEGQESNPLPAALIPCLCSAMGNRFLLDWLHEQTKALQPPSMPQRNTDTAVMAAQAGLLLEKVLHACCQAADAVGLDQEEAALLQRQLLAQSRLCVKAIAALEPLACGQPSTRPNDKGRVRVQ